MDKYAGKKKAAKKAAKKLEIKNILRNAALLGGASLSIGAGVKAIDYAADKGPDPFKRKLGYRRMLKESPGLTEKYDPKDVKKYYKTLFHFSERTAMDPVASSAWMKRSLQYKDVGPQTTDLKGLTDIEKGTRAMQRKPFADALSTGSLSSLSNLG